MTIQNIDDVMDRIMSLNRNLTEDSLRTLLSASGWDRDDIREGIKIFESRNKEKVSATPFNNGLGVDKNVTAEKKPTPAPTSASQTSTSAAQDEHALDDKEYSLNLKKRTDQSDQGTIEHEDFVSPSMRDNQVEKQDQEKIHIANVRGNAGIPIINPIKSSPTPTPSNGAHSLNPFKKFENKISEKIDTVKDSLESHKKLEDKTEDKTEKPIAATTVPTPPPTFIPTIPKNPKTDKLEDLTKPSHHKTGFAKLLFYILLLIVLLFVASYLLIPTFKNFINKEVFHNQSTLNITVPNGSSKANHTGNISSVIPNNPNQNNNLPPNQSSVNPGSTSSPVIPNQNPTGQGSQNPDYDQALASIEQEIADLRQKLTEYKDSKAETQTVVKYISQRGPAGAAGRGIASVEATSTGFIIHYTDYTEQMVNYSSTTKLDNVNAETVCFRDIPDPNATSTPAQFDICLNRQSLLNLLTNH